MTADDNDDGGDETAIEESVTQTEKGPEKMLQSRSLLPVLIQM